MSADQPDCHMQMASQDMEVFGRGSYKNLCRFNGGTRNGRRVENNKEKTSKKPRSAIFNCLCGSAEKKARDKQQEHQLTSTSRRESQHHKGRTISRKVIREEKVSIMTLDDREVTTQIFEIMHEHPGNSCHIIRDNNARISNIMNHSIATNSI